MEDVGTMEGIATNDVVLSIAAAGMAAQLGKGTNTSSSANTGHQGFGIKKRNTEISDEFNIDLPEQKNVSSPHRRPKTPTELLRRNASLSKRPSFSRPKSRFSEPSHYPFSEYSSQTVDLKTRLRISPMVSPRVSTSSSKPSHLIPKTPLAEEAADDEDDEGVYKSINLKVNKNCFQKLKFLSLLEWVVFIGMIALLISSLTMESLRCITFWSVPLLKWCILGLVIFCGRLVTEWFIYIAVYIVGLNLLPKKKVLYFIYGLKRSVQVFLWFASILVAWILLLTRGVERSARTVEVLHYVTMAIAGCLVGAGLWLLKTLLIKVIALSFHVKRFFDRIQESIFHQYVLLMLSGPAFMDDSIAKSRNELIFERIAKGVGLKEEVINVEKLLQINKKKVSAWTMRGLGNIIRRTKLTTIANHLDYDEDDEDDEAGGHSTEITSEWEARAAADRIFKNVAMPNHKYIDEGDLLGFMKMDDVHQVFPSFEGSTESGSITKSALRKWVVNAYLERKSLAHSLNDTKTAVKQLNKIASGVILTVDVIVWNLMMGFLTTKILVFITSQLLLVAFMFGNTVKTVFEAIIFVFIMHPFDVGDRCVIDGVQMTVEEMNILTTVFLRYDNEKIYYPNSVLSTKPISNYYRSPEMSDAIEFVVDFSTTIEAIAALKAKIEMYIDSKPQYWRPGHAVQVKDIVNMNKMMMGLYVNHTINFQNAGDRGSRRSDLVMKLKTIMEELKISYHLLPLEVHFAYVQ